MDNPFKMLADRLNTLENLLLDLKHETLPQLFKAQKEEELDQDRLLTKKEAAQLWGCSTSTIDNYRRAGILTPYRLGSAVRFKYAELKEAMEQMNTRKA
mgnify:CR=1 FL=1